MDFFTRAFGWRFQQWDDNPYWLAFTGPDGTGIDGAVAPAPEDRGPHTLNTIAVDDLEEATADAERAGGVAVTDANRHHRSGPLDPNPGTGREHFRLNAVLSRRPAGGPGRDDLTQKGFFQECNQPAQSSTYSSAPYFQSVSRLVAGQPHRPRATTPAPQGHRRRHPRTTPAPGGRHRNENNRRRAIIPTPPMRPPANDHHPSPDIAQDARRLAPVRTRPRPSPRQPRRRRDRLFQEFRQPAGAGNVLLHHLEHHLRGRPRPVHRPHHLPNRTKPAPRPKAIAAAIREPRPPPAADTGTRTTAAAPSSPLPRCARPQTTITPSPHHPSPDIAQEARCPAPVRTRPRPLPAPTATAAGPPIPRVPPTGGSLLRIPPPS